MQRRARTKTGQTRHVERSRSDDAFLSPLPPTVARGSLPHNNSDRGGGSGSDSDADKDNEDRDNDEEDVLVKQSREREQTAVDVTNAVLGALIGLLTKEIVRDAVGAAAPSKVKITSKGARILAKVYVKATRKTESSPDLKLVFRSKKHI